MAVTKHKHRKRSTKKAAALPVRKNSTLSQWGNSLGLRIPQDATEQLRLKPGEHVSIETRRDSLVVRPLRRSRKWTEQELLRGVRPAMVGGEVDWGPAVGKEIW